MDLAFISGPIRPASDLCPKLPIPSRLLHAAMSPKEGSARMIAIQLFAKSTCVMVNSGQYRQRFVIFPRSRFVIITSTANIAPS